jgi:hypothetical protein
MALIPSRRLPAMTVMAVMAGAEGARSQTRRSRRSWCPRPSDWGQAKRRRRRWRRWWLRLVAMVRRGRVILWLDVGHWRSATARPPWLAACAGRSRCGSSWPVGTPHARRGRNREGSKRYLTIKADRART